METMIELQAAAIAENKKKFKISNEFFIKVTDEHQMRVSKRLSALE